MITIIEGGWIQLNATESEQRRQERRDGVDHQEEVRRS